MPALKLVHEHGVEVLGLDDMLEDPAWRPFVCTAQAIKIFLREDLDRGDEARAGRGEACEGGFEVEREGGFRHG